MNNQEILLEKLLLKIDDYMGVLQQIFLTNTEEDLNSLPLGTKTVQAYKRKLKWEGTLKEFAELIIVLEEKGWITPIVHGERKAVIRATLNAFDFSKTRKSVDSDTECTLLQYLKPSEVGKKVFTKRYNQKFDDILPNDRKK